jgi:hypothetical protein
MATTSFVREAAEGASSGIVYLKNFIDDQTVPRGGIYFHHFQGHRENNPIVAKRNTDEALRVALRWAQKMYRDTFR